MTVALWVATVMLGAAVALGVVRVVTAKDAATRAVVGDLVFFSYGGGDISHVGIYLGGGAFIHATSNGGVKISYFDSYYSSTYVGAVRILAD